MTAQDLAAARARVEQRQRDLEAARVALAATERDEFAAALSRISPEVAALQLGTANSDSDTIDHIAAILGSVGFATTIDGAPAPKAVAR